MDEQWKISVDQLIEWKNKLQIGYSETVENQIYDILHQIMSEKKVAELMYDTNPEYAKECIERRLEEDEELYKSWIDHFLED